MNKQNLLACNILQSMDITVLKRTDHSTYELFGNIPDFYLDLFSDETGKPSCEPWKISPMMEFFIEDAERFFEQNREGTLCSSMWQEDGKTNEKTALIAIAATHGEDQVIIIRMLYADYYERVTILREARTQLLKNHSLSSNLEYFKQKSRIDGLTQIFNKTTFMGLLDDEIKRCTILDYSLALLIIDIDDFKKVNDTYGHLVGDTVLKELGILLGETLRQNDIVGRFGGEEFSILIPQVTEDQAVIIATKLRKKIAEKRFRHAGQITISTGCTIYIPMETAENFIERADIALYAAKKSGKNKVCTR